MSQESARFPIMVVPNKAAIGNLNFGNVGKGKPTNLLPQAVALVAALA